MFACQVILLSLLLINLLCAANLHGNACTGKHNFGTSLISAVLTFFLILVAGGFSKIFG